MNLGVAFAPLVSLQILLTAAAMVVMLSLVLLFARSRGAVIRVLGLALLMLALANPSLTREDRDPLSSIAVVVVDKSPSQNFGGRAQQTEAARAAITGRLSRIPGIEVRVIEAGQSDGETDGTRLFAALDARSPTCRPTASPAPSSLPTAASMMCRRMPGRSALRRRFMPSSPAPPNERDRRVVLIAAPRFGIVGQNQTISFRVEDEGVRPSPADVKISRDGECWNARRSIPGQQINIQVQIPHAGQNIIEIEAATLSTTS